jgi:hypothetical protein
MKLRIALPIPFLILAAAVAVVSLPGSSLGQDMDCVFCHSLHNSPGGTLNTNAEFDLICDSCHGPAGTAKFTDRHVDPTVNLASGNTGQPRWEMGCVVCHTPHGSDAVNHLFNNGTQHAHTLGGDSGNMVDGVNIKLFGRDEDSTGIAKVATPLRIIGVGPSASCPSSNTDLEIAMPRFNEGVGPLMTIMAGDRLTINNSNSEFDGEFRIKETDWSGFTATPPTGWVCFDRPTTASYTPASSDPTDGNAIFAFASSRGWDERPRIRRASWSLGTATLSLNTGYSIRVGDTIDVSGVSETNPGTFNGLKSVTAVSNTGITAASWSAGTATVTLAESHIYEIGDAIVVSDVISSGPGSFDGRFTVSGVSGSDVFYALASDPGTYANNGEIGQPIRSEVTYVAADPGTNNVAGGLVEFMGSVKSVQSMAVVTPPGPGPFLVTGLSLVPGSKATRPDTVTLTLDRTHPFGNNDTFTVTGIVSSGGDEYNGTWVVTGVPAPNQIEYENIWDPDPGTYVSGGAIADPAAPAPALEITLTNSDSNINQFQAATSGLRDGDIITVFGADPAEYNGRWEIESIALPVIAARCPPYFRADIFEPGCTLAGLASYVSGGTIQSTGSLRPVVLESRGGDNSDTNFLSDYTHSYTNTDQDQDGWMDGACEACHTQTANHQNDDFGNTHNNGKTCTAACHTHSQGFDKAGAFCPPGRTCPPVN